MGRTNVGEYNMPPTLLIPSNKRRTLSTVCSDERKRNEFQRVAHEMKYMMQQQMADEESPNILGKFSFLGPMQSHEVRFTLTQEQFIATSTLIKYVCKGKPLF